MTRLPFEQALGPAAAEASPTIRDRFLQPPGRRRYRGVMDRIWRAKGLRGVLAAPILWLSSRVDLLFRETGTNVPFEVENVVADDGSGRVFMTWTRSFTFGVKRRTFHATMTYDPDRRLIDDRLGKGGRLEVELEPRIVDGALHMSSRRQWIHWWRLRIRLPAIMAGRADIREWQRDDGRIGIRVTISNPMLGPFFGYEGSFERVE